STSGRRLAVVDICFSIFVFSIAACAVSRLISVSLVDFVRLLMALMLWRGVYVWAFRVRRFRPEQGGSSIPVHFRFTVHTVRWLALHLSSALLLASAAAFGVAPWLVSLFSIIAASHLALMFLPLTQWSLLLLTGPQTKKP